GEVYHIISEEVEVKAMAKEGFSVAEEGPYVAALVIDLTPELIAEGMAREFVRRVQDLRKSADLDVADRVELFIDASAGLRSAIETHRDYITSETLTTNLSFAAAPADSSVFEDEFDGENVKIGLNKV
ncbi:MAG TPA: DUF5915 domain-containing protein, partial [Anaerolineales bacterium]|nr:DUF5915 domain-containing protein [Anaerolineales bacterium]